MYSLNQADEGYGKRDPACALTEEEMELIDLSKIPETRRGLQIKCMIGFGALLGFRGSDEHTMLMHCQIGKGHFPSSHPLFPGFEWYGLLCFLNDKTNKLSSTNDYVQEEKDALGKFPVLSDGKTGNVKDDFGGAIKRYLETTAYCSIEQTNVEHVDSVL